MSGCGDASVPACVIAWRLATPKFLPMVCAAGVTGVRRRRGGRGGAARGVPSAACIPPGGLPACSLQRINLCVQRWVSEPSGCELYSLRAPPVCALPQMLARARPAASDFWDDRLTALSQRQLALDTQFHAEVSFLLLPSSSFLSSSYSSPLLLQSLSVGACPAAAACRRCRSCTAASRR